MPGRLYTGEEKYNIIMESFQNPNITIAEICREHGIAVSMFYKWKEQFLEGGRMENTRILKVHGDTAQWAMNTEGRFMLQ